MVVSRSDGNMDNSAMTLEERWSQLGRTFEESRRRMAGSTLYTLMAGAGAVTFLAGMEATLYIKPGSDLSASQKVKFVSRYSLAQIIPSIIHATQPPTVIAEVLGLPNIAKNIYATPCQAAPKRHLMLNRAKAIRGTMAGTVVLAQVLAIMGVLGNVRKDYVQRIRMGREPPLADSTRKGVVIRLAGEDSFVSNLTMFREGRRQFFPVFENAQHPDVKTLVNDHAAALPTPNDSASVNHHKIESRLARVPVFWRVRDGAYSHKASWRGMVVPRSWLFPLPTTKPNEKPKQLLILEADATCTAMSLQRQKCDDFDLDLYEVAQGFTQLQSLVEDQGEAEKKRKDKSTFETIRILLVDCDAIYTSGGGRQQTTRAHAAELGLADVIVDARKPLLYSLTTWLEQHHSHSKKQKRQGWFGPFQKRPVILETPRRDWFLSIQGELANHGYQVMDRADALDQFGTLEDIPFFVYERTTADTLNTVKQMVTSNTSPQMTTPENVCALCPRPWVLEAIMDTAVEGVTYVSSSDIYDRLLRWVRYQALQGKSAAKIQEELDTELPAILHKAMTSPQFANRRFTEIAEDFM